ncbi:glycosyltransferase family protein [Fructobacillus ficulneus]|uniref:Putative ATP synthase F0, A subunit n=1 Tax=Fructobacillus ficulneus TaxID=157463 RepID=A0A0K8MFY9_9LACO|nr:hypothetical protein [Fructobacillus ficulneus]GAO99113.1 putative ATP synthase F0, A subunit [Fructobacillus ficulneus]
MKTINQFKVKANENNHIFDLFLILILTIISVLPAFLHGYYNSSVDGIYHFARFENIASSLKSDTLPSLFNFNYAPINSYQGVAINAMYPWLDGLLFIVPRIVISNPLHAMEIGFFLLNFLTIFNMRLLAGSLSSNRWIIWLGVIVYEFNNFHLIDLYSRTALGECFGYAWMPLVVLGLLQLHQNKKSSPFILGLSLGMIANAHVLSLVLAVIFVLVFEILKNDVTLKVFKNALLSFFIFLAISSYSLFNIINIYVHSKIATPERGIVSVDLSSFLTSNFGNNMAEKTYWIYGLPLLVIQIVLTVILFKNMQSSNWRKWLIAADILFIISLNWWPWSIFVKTPISLLQFLSRLNLFIVLFLSIAIVMFFNEKKKVNKRNIILIGIIVCFVSLAGTYQNRLNYNGLQSNHYSLNADNYESILHSTSSFNDYIPLNKNGKKLNISNSKVPKQISGKSNQSVYKVDLDHESVVDFPVVTYQGFNYNIFIDGIRSKSLDTNQVSVKLSKGRHIIKIEAPYDRSSLLLFISILSISITILILFFLRF